MSNEADALERIADGIERLAIAVEEHNLVALHNAVLKNVNRTDADIDADYVAQKLEELSVARNHRSMGT